MSRVSLRRAVLYPLAFLTVLGVGATAYAQRSAPASEDNARTSESATRVAFRDAVKQQLAQIKNGAWLYSKCDLFQRSIDRRVAKKFFASNEALSLPDEALSGATDISKTSSDEDETSIAINGVKPSVIAAGANDDGMYTLGMPVYLSTNGGSAWRTYRIPAPIIADCSPGGDPVVVCDDNGTFYYSYLLYDYTGSDSSVSDIIVAHSSDGIHWANGRGVMSRSTPAPMFEDKETIAVDCDPSSPHHGRLYVAWVHYDQENRVASQRFAWSDDKGATWAQPVDLSTDVGYFPLLRVGKGGTVFLSSSSGDGEFGSDVLFVSTDGGANFQQHIAANYIDYPQNNDYRSGLKGPDGFRSFPYFTFDVDASTNTLYAAFANYESDGYASLYTITSNDLGNTWSDPVFVSTPGSEALDHFMPWVSYDQATKTAYLSFYSSEEDQSNVKSRFVRTTFSDPTTITKLANNLFDPTSVGIVSSGSPFIGDYVGSDAYAGVFAAAWTENRPLHGDGEIFASIINPASGVAAPVQINATDLELSAPVPNPVTGSSVSLTVQSSATTIARAELYDARGVRVLTQSIRLEAAEGSATSVTFDVCTLPAGTYTCRVIAGNTEREQKIVLVR